MNKRRYRKASLTGIACMLALVGCKVGTDSTAPPSPAPGTAPAPESAAPVPTLAPLHSNTGPAVKPPAGFGNAQGRVL